MSTNDVSSSSSLVGPYNQETASVVNSLNSGFSSIDDNLNLNPKPSSPVANEEVARQDPIPGIVQEALSGVANSGYVHKTAHETSFGQTQEAERDSWG